MRKPNGLFSLERSAGKAQPSWPACSMIRALWFMLPWEARAEGGKSDGQKQAHVDYARPAGTWVSLDGGYVMELKAGISV